MDTINIIEFGQNSQIPLKIVLYWHTPHSSGLLRNKSLMCINIEKVEKKIKTTACKIGLSGFLVCISKQTHRGI